MKLHIPMLILFVLLPSFAMAGPQMGQDKPAMATGLARDLVIPSYSALADVTEQQRNVWQQGCSDKQALKEAYHRTSDAWAAVYYRHFGPMALEERLERFYHWPERRNAVGRGLASLLADEDPAKLKVERFSNTGIAVQGLPALERLLFGKHDVSNNEWECRVGQTIASNLNDIAAAARGDWNETFLPAIEADAKLAGAFESAQDALNRQFTDFIGGFTILIGQKLYAVMGPSIEKARPRKAEAWRSDRSIRNIKLNLEALAIEADYWAQYADENTQTKVRAMFADAKQQLEGISDLQGAVKNEQQRMQLEALTNQLDQISQFFTETLAEKIGVSLGFNGLDGD